MTPGVGRGAAEAESAAEAFARRDPFWPAQISVLATIALDLDLPNKLTLRPGWILPALEGVLLIGLIAITPWQAGIQRQRRVVALTLIGVVSAANLLSLGCSSTTCCTRVTSRAST
jgi:hypothetical protein